MRCDGPLRRRRTAPLRSRPLPQSLGPPTDQVGGAAALYDWASAGSSTCSVVQLPPCMTTEGTPCPASTGRSDGSWRTWSTYFTSYAGGAPVNSKTIRSYPTCLPDRMTRSGRRSGRCAPFFAEVENPEQPRRCGLEGADDGAALSELAVDVGVDFDADAGGRRRWRRRLSATPSCLSCIPSTA